MILKSYTVEGNLEILKNYKATLIYGENDGIKDDIKDALRDKNNNSEIVNLFTDDILKNKTILYENIVNGSLFGEKKIIFIQEASDKIFDQINECIEKENINVNIYIFSRNLEKKSKLRNLFETNKNLAIFACYEDNERTLIYYISKELKNFKGLSGEIINLIISNSNMNRKIIKNEIIKIRNYFLEKKITKKEVLEILNIKIENNFDKIRDSALSGEKKKINQLLSEIDLLNEDTFFYLNSLNYRVLRLQEIIKISEGNKNKYEQVLEEMRPSIFWKEKPMVMQQLKKWGPERLVQLAIKINQIEILMKKNSYIRNDIIIKDFIINITREASSTF